MKKIILAAALMAAMFTGCASHDAHYAKAKETYIAGKAIADIAPKDRQVDGGLDLIDLVVVEYDTIRSWVRGEDASGD